MAPRSFGIRRFVPWLRQALNLSESEIPVALRAETDDKGTFAPVTLTLDAYQSGIAVAQLFAGHTDFTAGVIGTAFDFDSQASPSYGYLVLAISLNTSSVATGSIWLQMIPLDGAINANKGSIFNRTAIGNTVTAVSWATLIGGSGDSRVFIPPGFKPQLFETGLSNGDVVTADFVMLKVPAGFKPY